MTRAKKVGLKITLLLLVAVGMIIAWDQAFPSASYRFRMTVEVDTPQGLKTGSSVMEFELGKALSLGLPDAHSMYNKFRGEAVAIDISPHQTMFALLNDPTPGEGLGIVVTRTFKPGYRLGEALIADVHELGSSGSRGKTAELQSWNYPMLVRFRDITDPKSVEKVEPDNLEAAFGKGVALKRITLQITDDAVITGIEKRMPKPPFARSYVYRGENSDILKLYDGKVVSELINLELFKKGE